MKTGPQVFIVDDNRKFIDRMISLLERVVEPSDIGIASDYEEAREAFLKGAPQAVLLDINLPGKSGIELLKFFKQQQPGLCVIMVTNHADDYYRQLCIGLGATYFLDKSNDFAQLPGILARIIGAKNHSGCM